MKGFSGTYRTRSGWLASDFQRAPGGFSGFAWDPKEKENGREVLWSAAGDCREDSGLDLVELLREGAAYR